MVKFMFKNIKKSALRFNAVVRYCRLITLFNHIRIKKLRQRALELENADNEQPRALVLLAKASGPSLLRQRYQREFSAPQQAVSVKVGNEKQDDNNKKERISPAQQAFLRQLNSVLERHVAGETFDVSHLVHEMNLSHSQLGRKTKTLLNLTPSEAIRHFRLKKAAELLLQGKTAGSVFHQVGFASHSYFSHCFKALYYCSPSQYCVSNQPG